MACPRLLQVHEPGFRDCNNVEVQPGLFVTREDIVELKGYSSLEQAGRLLEEVRAGRGGVLSPACQVTACHDKSACGHSLRCGAG